MRPLTEGAPCSVGKGASSFTSPNQGDTEGETNAWLPKGYAPDYALLPSILLAWEHEIIQQSAFGDAGPATNVMPSSSKS